MHKFTRKFLLSIFSMALLAAPAGSFAADTVAMTYTSGTTIDWDPFVPNPVTLSMSGAGGFYQQMVAQEGETLSFSAYGSQGGQLPDGQYRYNLRSIDGAGRPVVQDGYFRLESGRIIINDAVTAEYTGPAGSAN